MVLWLLVGASAALAQSTSFTYQGRLTDGGTAANGNYDLQFTLFDSLSGGAQVGSTLALNTVAVSNGVFTVSLDFGANSFPGANRFLEISARPTGGSFTLLTPRQPITSTPYALRALNASSADSIPPSGVPAGSGNYIQNNSTQQSASNFNISGNGTAGGTLSSNLVNATTQYNLNGSRILSNSGTGNLFAGVGAGAANTTGTRNTFIGSSSGAANTTFCCNTFIGFEAGKVNTGGANTFVGEGAGDVNTTGGGNAFFGRGAGGNNMTGSNNAFFGEEAGVGSLTGDGNTFLGTFSGVGSADAGSNNTAIGFAAFVGGNLTNATAVGAGAGVTASNALVLGSISPAVNVGIGTTTPATRLHVVGNTSLVGDVGIGTTAPLRLLHVNGRARIGTIPLEASNASLCFLGSTGDLVQCGASSLKWKTNVQPFLGGLDIVRRLRPINFNWKESGLPDIGLGAEDVAKVAPSFTFTDDKGEVTGVKYERLNMLLINAIKEQQTQIATLQQVNSALNARLHKVERALRKKSSAVRRR